MKFSSIHSFEYNCSPMCSRHCLAAEIPCRIGLGQICIPLCGGRGGSHTPTISNGFSKGKRFCYQKERELLGNQQQRYPLSTVDAVFVYRKPNFLIHLELEHTELTKEKKKLKIFGIFSHETQSLTLSYPLCLGSTGVERS